VEAYVLNKDIGFIKEGQEAVIKVESFPFTRYGTIAGKVVRIARDAISQPEAAQAEANPGQPNAAPGPGGAQRTQNLVFSVIVRPDKTFLTADGVKTPMSPGMTVAIEIKTGKRRILEYVFAPLIKTSADALKER
ncbi:MAG: HlyD family efflux transporter periplasmic adaptor subunit, partial [Beijerinckiaceae bacterium]